MDYPTCPYCGYEAIDNYFEYRSGLHECEECGRLFMLEVETRNDYQSEFILAVDPKPKGGGEHGT